MVHRPIELSIDVTNVAELGIPARIAASVFIPDDPLYDAPVVCFAFPGGGYSRRYYSFDMPDSSGGGQAGFHCDRGWIFVSVDHLGVGDSTVPDPNTLSIETIAAANNAAVEAVMEMLNEGTLEGLAPISRGIRVGIGQSMGGFFTIVLQGRHATFDAIAILGFSGIHTIVPTKPGTPAYRPAWIPRVSGLDNPTILNQSAFDADFIQNAAANGEHFFSWVFHYDDAPNNVVAFDMGAYSASANPLPDWRSATIPAAVIYGAAPGAAAPEAASITVPVLVAVGERDVVPDPWQEPRAFKSCDDVTVFICPHMGHMHNFASTRSQFWQRIHSWGSGVSEMQAYVDCAI